MSNCQKDFACRCRQHKWTMGNILHFAVLAILIWILILKNLNTSNTPLTLGEPHKPKHTLSTLSSKHDSTRHRKICIGQKIITQNPEFTWQGIPSFQRVPSYHYGLFWTVSPIPMKNRDTENFHSSLTINNGKLIWYFRSPLYTIVLNMTHFLIPFGMREKNGLFWTVFHLYWCKI